MTFQADFSDPYANCEVKCLHDLVPGMLVSDLLGTEDGPHPMSTKLYNSPSTLPDLGGLPYATHPSQIT